MCVGISSGGASSYLKMNLFNELYTADVSEANFWEVFQDAIGLVIKCV